MCLSLSGCRLSSGQRRQSWFKGSLSKQGDSLSFQCPITGLSNGLSFKLTPYQITVPQSTWCVHSPMALECYGGFCQKSQAHVDSWNSRSGLTMPFACCRLTYSPRTRPVISSTGFSLGWRFIDTASLQCHKKPIYLYWYPPRSFRCWDKKMEKEM